MRFGWEMKYLLLLTAAAFNNETSWVENKGNPHRKQTIRFFFFTGDKQAAAAAAAAE